MSGDENLEILDDILLSHGEFDLPCYINEDDRAKILARTELEGVDMDNTEELDFGVLSNLSYVNKAFLFTSSSQQQTNSSLGNQTPSTSNGGVATGLEFLSELDVKPNETEKDSDATCEVRSHRKSGLGTRNVVDVEMEKVLDSNIQPVKTRRARKKTLFNKSTEVRREKEVKANKTQKKPKTVKKEKKVKMWQLDVTKHPEVKDAVSAKKRRDRIKNEGSEQKQEIQRLKNEIENNYIHKDDTAKLVQRVTQLGYRCLVPEVRDGVLQEAQTSYDVMDGSFFG